MANTYSQLYIQIIFSVKDRYALITEQSREEIQKYITGIIAHNKCKLYAIYANPDHVHLLIAIPPSILIANLVRDIKANSSRFINEKKLLSHRFGWQEGYGAFSYSQSQIEKVVTYILNQPNITKNVALKKNISAF